MHKKTNSFENVDAIKDYDVHLLIIASVGAFGVIYIFLYKITKPCINAPAFLTFFTL